jgi:hypothetical protein
MGDRPRPQTRFLGASVVGALLLAGCVSQEPPTPDDSRLPPKELRPTTTVVRTPYGIYWVFDSPLSKRLLITPSAGTAYRASRRRLTDAMTFKAAAKSYFFRQQRSCRILKSERLQILQWRIRYRCRQAPSAGIPGIPGTVR